MPECINAVFNIITYSPFGSVNGTLMRTCVIKLYMIGFPCLNAHMLTFLDSELNANIFSSPAPHIMPFGRVLLFVPTHKKIYPLSTAGLMHKWNGGYVEEKHATQTK